ncbi:MAG: ankyrin repeat domain-containing protein [Aureispira sp.]
MENGAEVDYHAGRSMTALEEAINSEVDLEVIDYLIDCEATINSKSGQIDALVSAIYSRNIDLVKYLISRGGIINQIKDLKGRNTLEIAQYIGEQDIIDFLKRAVEE